MNHLGIFRFQKIGLQSVRLGALVILCVLAYTGQVSAQSNHIVTKGFFYAPTPCELVETGGDICATVTVPLAANFSFEPVSRVTKKRFSSFRGSSNRQGYFSIKVPPGKYRVAVRGVSYRVFGGGRKSVDVTLVPAQSVVSIPRKGGVVLQIPLVRQ